jgi:hypothetical protein
MVPDRGTARSRKVVVDWQAEASLVAVPSLNHFRQPGTQVPF